MRSKSFRAVVGLAAAALIVQGLPYLSLANFRQDDVERLVPKLADARAVAAAPSRLLRGSKRYEPSAKGIRVALLSSGVDRGVLPEPLNAQVGGAVADGIGYGTYAATVLLQLAEDMKISSFNVVNAKGRLDHSRLAAALDWAKTNAKAVDAVLVAVPPQELLDPISDAMNAGRWNRILDAMSDHPVRGPDGTVIGVPLDAATRREAFAAAPDADRKAVESFAQSVTAWNRTREQIRALGAAGVPVVVPAGDLGPGLQTIFGLGNLPEVITVGGFDGRGVSRSSASGPSIDGRVKPDLVAPTGFPGALPEPSTLAKELGVEGLLAPDLRLLWDAVEPNTLARARLDTTMTSAAVVAASAAGMANEGVRDVGRVRGALVAASVPLDGVAVWRQGAGVLRRAPDAAFADSRPLALAHGDLGAEPDGDAWTTTVPFAQGAPASGRSGMTDFAGVAPDGNFLRGVRADESPRPAVRVTDRGLELTLPAGDNRYEGGVYCGYTDVVLPTTGGAVRPGVVIDGIPAGVEQVPTCLVKGTRLRAHGFYIHDLPAENLTFALLPALPEEASVVEAHLHILPIDPMGTKLFFKVTGADGNADFPNVPPGYYRIRQFSDYGSPVTDTVFDSQTGKPVVRTGDLGANPAYQSFDALVLSALSWTEKDLQDRFGAENVAREKPTGTYIVTIGPKRIRVALDFVKKMPGPAVTSRVIDLMTYEDLDFNALRVLPGAQLPQVVRQGPAGDLRGWTFSPALDDAEDLLAQFNPALAGAQGGAVLGVGTYPFNLTLPNYSAHMSLNFSYELTNALIAVIVRMGNQTATGLVTPVGTVRSPTIGTDSPLGQNGLAVAGKATGLANFDFKMLPRGAAEGSITFVFIPSRPVQQVASPLAAARIGDLSFSLSTWTNTLWPATTFTPVDLPSLAPPIPLQGHDFTFDSNYSTRQMNATGCRPIDSGGVKADVCEDWQVLIHSPGIDAATVDLKDRRASITPELRSGPSLYADPHRGTFDFSHVLAFDLPVGGLAALGATIPNDFKTNGRFWEQLALTRDVLADHPDAILVQIIDNLNGRRSTIAPRVDGGVPVPPYVPFESEATVVGGGQLSLGDVNGDGVPEISLGTPVGSLGDPTAIDLASPAPAAAPGSLPVVTPVPLRLDAILPRTKAASAPSLGRIKLKR